MTQDVIRERVDIPGPRGLLRGELAYPHGRPTWSCAVFNPHPHMGGSADNPLVAAISTAVAEAGGVSLRFDYAGVGRNSADTTANLTASMAAFWETGHAPEDPGMIADATAASRWLDRTTGGLPLLLVGYSFGAYVASACPAAASKPPPAALALISPTLTHHDFGPLRAPTAPPLLVVYADDDFATPSDVTRGFLASLPRPPRSHAIPGGEHFFRGSERVVAGLVTDFFRSVLEPGSRLDRAKEAASC